MSKSEGLEIVAPPFFYALCRCLVHVGPATLAPSNIFNLSAVKITGAASQPQRQDHRYQGHRFQDQDQPTSYEPSLDYHSNTTVVDAADYGYAGMSAGSTAAIVQALDGSQSPSSSDGAYASSPSLESTTSSDESFVPSEEEKDDLEEFLLDAFDGFDATEISAI